VRATRQSGNSAPEEVTSAAEAIVELGSVVDVAGKVLRFSGPFNNMGPIPPKAGSQTTYSIVWTVKNSSNTVANAQVRTTLPPYVSFAGVSGTEKITYDDTTRTVVWNLGDVRAGAGYTYAIRQGVFQIVLTPSISQVGQAPFLTGDITFSGEDRFAQMVITKTAPGPTTAFTEDTGFTKGMDIIQGQ